MIAFGAVDALFSFFVGTIVEWTGRPVMVGLGALVNMIVIILFLMWKPNSATLYMFFLLSGLWGFSDAIWQTQITG